MPDRQSSPDQSETARLRHGPSWLDSLRQPARCAKESGSGALTLRNWSVGFHIDHYELTKADRSQYGDELYHRLADGLRALGVKSCDRRQLYRYRDFFQAYPQIAVTLSP